MQGLEILGTGILSVVGSYTAWKFTQWVDYLLHDPTHRTIGKKMGQRIDYFAQTGVRR